MSNNTQSSIEWFKKELEDYGTSERLKIDWKTFDELFEQAKAMEKQRMFDFAKSFVYTWNYITKGNFESTKDMNKELENLFEETYGGVNK